MISYHKSRLKRGLLVYTQPLLHSQRMMALTTVPNRLKVDEGAKGKVKAEVAIEALAAATPIPTTRVLTAGVLIIPVLGALNETEPLADIVELTT